MIWSSSYILFVFRLVLITLFKDHVEVIGIFVQFLHLTLKLLFLLEYFFQERVLINERTDRLFSQLKFATSR